MTEEEKRPRGRPATGVTPKRYLRVGPLWDEAAQVAELRGETITAFVIRAIENELQRVTRGRKHVDVHEIEDRLRALILKSAANQSQEDELVSLLSPHVAAWMQGQAYPPGRKRGAA